MICIDAIHDDDDGIQRVEHGVVIDSAGGRAGSKARLGVKEGWV